jgi:hypothetical protein
VVAEDPVTAEFTVKEFPFVCVAVWKDSLAAPGDLTVLEIASIAAIEANLENTFPMLDPVLPVTCVLEICVRVFIDRKLSLRWKYKIAAAAM